MRFWIDAAFLSIPIPVYEWPYPLKLGYFEDIEKVYNKNRKVQNRMKEIFLVLLHQN